MAMECKMLQSTAYSMEYYDSHTEGKVQNGKNEI